MNSISELRNFIIRRFIISVVIISLGEYLMMSLVNSTIVRFISYAFFDGMDISALKVSGAIFALVAYLGAMIIELLSYIIPSQMRITMEGARNYIEQHLQTYMLRLPNAGKYVSLRTVEKFFLILLLLLAVVLLLLPYIIGAIYFASLVIKRFRVIEQEERDNEVSLQKQRNLMLSDIAHDLRTPMTTVSGYARALSDDMVSEDKKKEYMQAIIRKSDRMNELITLLFDYVRVDSEGFALKKENIDICELTRECVATLYPDIEGAGMELELSIPEQRHMICADRLHLSRVINNLIVNAIKHNKKGTRIGVILKPDGTRLRLAIADSGELIDENTAAHIFEPFVMGDESRNSRGGTGLGLSVADKIISLHGYSLKLIQKPYTRKYDLPAIYNKMFYISIRTQ